MEYVKMCVCVYTNHKQHLPFVVLNGCYLILLTSFIFSLNRKLRENIEYVAL